MSRSSTVLDKAVVTRAPPELNIVAAMDHPGLFGQWYSGPSWDNWRAVLKAAYALTMSTGRDIVDHPKGDRHHDDLANAVAGALALAGARKQTLVITNEHVAMVAARGPYRGSAMSSLESRMGERAYALLRSGRRF